MVYELVMPRLGWTMEEGTFLEWLKQDGDTIQEGDIVFTVENDKAVNEVEALASGILRIPPNAPAPGTVLPVGALIGYIVAPGESFPVEGEPPVAVTPNSTQDTTVAANGAAPMATSSRRSRDDMPAISPRAKRIAAELGVAWHMLSGSGRTGRIVERDVRMAAALSAPSQPSSVRVTPLARRVAHELGVDLQEVASHKGRERITRADVVAASSAALQMPPSAPEDAEESIPISATRRVTAERMLTSAQTTAPVTLNIEVDATELVRLRNQLKADASDRDRLVPSYNDLLARLCAEALREHPQVNARFQAERIVISRAVHIGIAVDTERGLLVPVVRDAHLKSVRQIAAESRALIARARDGKLGASEMRGSTFSITNLGMFGIDSFTPIINLPECAILGVGRIVAKQVVVDAKAERLAVRQMMFLSLTFDHRLIDGAQAARFLQRIRQFIEQPYLWLV
ncbi:MAG: dihydrolipoamide acetyltransferase [Anaerolineae bacterium]